MACIVDEEAGAWTKKPVRGRANTFKYLVHDPERHPGEAARSSF